MSKNKSKKNIYLIGVKGVGMTMLAQFLVKKGNRISGSDNPESFMTDRVLKKEKIKVFSPFAPQNIPDNTDLIIHSLAYSPENNSELSYIKKNSARFKNIPVITYSEALGQVFNEYYGIAVCGSHGKTTTSAWLGYVLAKAGKKPNVLVGSRVPQFNGSSLIGSAKYFVAEVDEYKNKLQYCSPQGVVLNNIEFDHPDYFKNQAAYTKVFADFIKKIPAGGWLVMNNHDFETKKIKKYCRGRVMTYDVAPTGGTVPTVNYLAQNLKIKRGLLTFTVNDWGEFKISLWGEHNVYNALAVIAAARTLGVPLETIRKHLAGFKGTERRAQVLGTYRGSTIIDDYAHHPTEIQATLEGVRARYPRKNIITVFHPHTYTRTKALFKDFVTSFTRSDELIVLDIYGSAREKQGGVSSAQLVKAIAKYNSGRGLEQKVRHIATISEAAAYFRGKLNSSDLLLLMGAGDVFRLGETLLKYGR
ncbi:MAG: UDP-N-acetylmuramate--L-alanine ligase [Patescibacteria group bacterium]